MMKNTHSFPSISEVHFCYMEIPDCDFYFATSCIMPVLPGMLKCSQDSILPETSGV